MIAVMVGDAEFFLTRRRALAMIAGGAGAAALSGLAGCHVSAAGAGGATVLEFWTLALRPFADYIGAMLDDFEQLHPGVRVRWVDVPYEALDRKLIAAAAAGRSPDLVNFSDKTFARYVSMGATADLTGRLPGDASTTFVPGALRLGMMSNRLLALPWYLTTQTVLGNEALLSVGGLSVGGSVPGTKPVPNRWAALRSSARAYHSQTGRSLFSVPLGAESDLPMMLLAEGINPFEPAGAGGVAGVRANLRSRAVFGCVNEWVDLYRRGALPREAATHGSAHLPDLYQNGRIALINSGPNFLKRIADIAPSVFATTTSGPPITGALGRAHIAVMVLCVMSTSAQPDLAAELAWHVTSAKYQELLCKRAVILPSTVSSLGDSMFSANGFAGAAGSAGAKVHAARATTAQALRTAVAFTPTLPRWPDMRRVLEDRIKGALLDGRDVSLTLAEIERDWNRILADSPPATGPATMDAVPPLTPAPGVTV